MKLEPLIRGSLLRLFHVLTCIEVEKMSYDFLDGNLKKSLMFRIRVHMLSCWRCLKFLKSYRSARDLGRNLPVPSLDPQFKEELLAALLRAQPG